MSHNIHHFDYPADVSKDEVFQQLNNFVRCEDWGEGGHLHPIRWLSEPPLDSRYDAEQYIEKNDKGWYDCLAVRYREPKPGMQSKAYLDLQQRFRKADMRYREMNQEVYATTITSAFIGCKNCGSKLSRKHLLSCNRGNYCPVCNADLRPASTLEKIRKAHASMLEIGKKMDMEKCRMARRNGEVRWLVKIEYHT